MNLRQEKVASLIKDLASKFINREASRESIITVIRTDVSKDLEKSDIYVTVLPEDKQENALKFLKRKRGDFKEFFKDRVDLKNIPHFDFKIDTGEKKRQKIDELLKDS